MTIGDHMEGFDKEVAFDRIFFEIEKYCPDLRRSQLRTGLASIAPAFVDGLYERRVCLRTLRYVGCTWDSESEPGDDEFFKVGQTYVGTTFNGGTYTIDGYGDALIGFAYFDWIK